MAWILRFGFDFEYTGGSWAIAMNSDEDEQQQQPKKKKKLISTAITHYAKLEYAIDVAYFWGFWIRMVYCVHQILERGERVFKKWEANFLVVYRIII